MPFKLFAERIDRPTAKVLHAMKFAVAVRTIDVVFRQLLIMRCCVHRIAAGTKHAMQLSEDPSTHVVVQMLDRFQTKYEIERVIGPRQSLAIESLGGSPIGMRDESFGDFVDRVGGVIRRVYFSALFEQMRNQMARTGTKVENLRAVEGIDGYFRNSRNGGRQ